MIIRVAELPDEGLSIDETAYAASPYADPAWHLDRLQLQVTKDGEDVDVIGQISATVPQTCGRCTEACTSPVSADVSLRFAPKPARVDNAELGRDDLDTDFYVTLATTGQLLIAEQSSCAYTLQGASTAATLTAALGNVRWASGYSGRAGIICSVTARPIRVFSGWRTCHPASHWFRKPRAFNPRTSSDDMSFSFSSNASGTFGRPSGNRSNGFWAVYLIICSLPRLNT